MKNRALSGFVIIVILILSLVLDKIVFTILMSICSILALREILNIKYKDKQLLFVKMLSYLSIILVTLNNNLFEIDYKVIIIFPIIGLLMLLVYYNNYTKYNINDVMYILGSIIFLGFAFNSLIYFRNIDVSKCIYIFLVSCITDTYAYIGGMLIGKHKLTTISPKKTWEGSIVGTLMGVIIGTVFWMIVVGNTSLVTSIILSLALTILSEIGDLVFSSIKRYFEVKDYSSLIPGHGGLLDRFDSIIFVSLGLSLILSIM